MRLIMLLFKLLLLFVPIVLLGLPIYLLVSAVQPLPLVDAGGSIEQEDVGRARELFDQHDPRQLEDGEVKQVVVTERDLKVMLLSMLPAAGGQRMAVDLGSGSADIYYTVSLPENPLGRFLNLSLHVVQQKDRLQLDKLRAGDATLPGWLLNPVVGGGNFVLKKRFEEYRGAMAALHEVELNDDALHLVYQWDTELAAKIEQRGRDFLLPEADRERVLAYYAEISRQSHLLDSSGSLVSMLQPLFTLARQRSELNGDAGAENRALFLALGVAAREGSIETLLGSAAAELPRAPDAFRYTLGQRADLSNRFILSAAITATGGGALAQAVGVFKEVDDSRGGSGFSFPDLLADRAGRALAESAMGSRSGEIQRFMAGRPREPDFMPSIANLPEGLQQMSFERRFEDLDSASYRAVNDEMERRISACALYR